MKALVIGGGGREHALIWKLAQSRRFDELFACPGNPGMAELATCLKPEGTNPQSYLDCARAIDAGLTIVGPEAPLVGGIVDLFRNRGHRIIGPTAEAARIEGSKAFSKSFMIRAGIPTARAATAPDAHAAANLVSEFGFPVVLKADGLAAGKGVVIAGTHADALNALNKLPAGQILVEEFLTGEEVSYIVLAEGDRFQPLAATQDHKAINDGDQGPNTGGMGAYCDGRILSRAEEADIEERVIRPALRQMKADGEPYTGFLYAGLMMTMSGPKVLEFNARLGDPETQPLMHRLSADLGDCLLDGAPFTWRDDPSVCVVMTAHGYPGETRLADPITGIEGCGATVFHAGTRVGGRGLETAGGRVLGVTSSASNLKSAIDSTYAAVRKIHFDGLHYRTDIGSKGLRRW